MLNGGSRNVTLIALEGLDIGLKSPGRKCQLVDTFYSVTRYISGDRKHGNLILFE